MQDLFQLQQPLGLLLGDLLYRNTRPAGHHGGNIRRGHFFYIVGRSVLPLLLFLIQQVLQALFLIPQLCRLLKVLAAHGSGLFCRQALDLRFHLFQVRRGCISRQAYFRAGLINQVNGLIRLEPIGNVPAAHLHRVFNSGVGNFHLMVGLVLIPQTFQNFHGLLLGRLAHGHRLEPALQGGVLFNILAVLVNGSGTDHLDLTTSQSGL